MSLKNPFIREKSGWQNKKTIAKDIIVKPKEEIKKEEPTKKVEVKVSQPTKKEIKKENQKEEHYGELITFKNIQKTKNLDNIFNKNLNSYISHYNEFYLQPLLDKKEVEWNFSLKIYSFIDSSEFIKKRKGGDSNYLIDMEKVYHTKGGFVILEDEEKNKKEIIMIYDYFTSSDELDKKQYQKKIFFENFFSHLNFFPLCFFVSNIKDDELISFNNNLKINTFYNRNLVINNKVYQPISIFKSDEGFNDTMLFEIFKRTLDNAIMNIL